MSLLRYNKQVSWSTHVFNQKKQWTSYHFCHKIEGCLPLSRGEVSNGLTAEGRQKEEFKIFFVCYPAHYQGSTKRNAQEEKAPTTMTYVTNSAGQINNEQFPPNTKPNACKHATTRVTNTGIQKMECKGIVCRKIRSPEDQATREGIPTLHLCRPSRTQIQAMSYTADTTIVDIVLEPMATYIISNAKILPCNIQFRIVNHPFQWNLTTSTSMEPTMDIPLSQPLAVPAFRPFLQFEQHKSSDTNLNVLAIVIDTSNPRTVNGMYDTSNVQNLVLITTEKIPFYSVTRTTSSHQKLRPSSKLHLTSPSLQASVFKHKNSEASH